MQGHLHPLQDRLVSNVDQDLKPSLLEQMQHSQTQQKPEQQLDQAQECNEQVIQELPPKGMESEFQKCWPQAQQMPLEGQFYEPQPPGLSISPAHDGAHIEKLAGKELQKPQSNDQLAHGGCEGEEQKSREQHNHEQVSNGSWHQLNESLDIAAVQVPKLPIHKQPVEEACVSQPGPDALRGQNVAEEQGQEQREENMVIREVLVHQEASEVHQATANEAFSESPIVAEGNGAADQSLRCGAPGQEREKEEQKAIVDQLGETSQDASKGKDVEGKVTQMEVDGVALDSGSPSEITEVGKEVSNQPSSDPKVKVEQGLESIGQNTNVSGAALSHENQGGLSGPATPNQNVHQSQCLSPGQPSASSGEGQLSTGQVVDPQKREQQYINQRQCLLWLQHTMNCNDSDCKTCPRVKPLLAHLKNCQTQGCMYQGCAKFRPVFHHYLKCKDETCPVCPYVRRSLWKLAPSAASVAVGAHTSLSNPRPVVVPAVESPLIPPIPGSSTGPANSGSFVVMSPSSPEVTQTQLPPAKRVKVNDSPSAVSTKAIQQPSVQTQLLKSSQSGAGQPSQVPSIGASSTPGSVSSHPFQTASPESRQYPSLMATGQPSSHFLNSQFNKLTPGSSSAATQTLKGGRPGARGPVKNASLRPVSSNHVQSATQTSSVGLPNTASGERRNSAGLLHPKLEGSTHPKMEPSSRLVQNNIKPDLSTSMQLKAEPIMSSSRTTSVGSQLHAKQERMSQVKADSSQSSKGGVPSSRANTALSSSSSSLDGKKKLAVGNISDSSLGQGAIVPQPTQQKPAKPKVPGISLTELFTAEQIGEHIRGLRQWVGQSKAKAAQNIVPDDKISENACRLCAVEKLAFEPPPLYCTACGARVKRNASYWAVSTGSETNNIFCVTCYNDAKSDTLEIEGGSCPKSKLVKKKNEETEEAWVQCDKCEKWQHQICALFNGRRNEGGDAEYTCPDCCMVEMERGERKPLSSSAVLGAKDLPRTALSDYLEKRLANSLKREAVERARHFGISIDEVPTAEGLVIRVVSSVDKKLDVKQRFMEIFQNEDYPAEFPYKSKVLLLFQKIEGVEVCLFGMYTQEFGTDCPQPNTRRVYLSYLDSVKYFRPEVKTVDGQALRTFVYHEILIGYLQYTKMRGFSSCYIWACPPLKGEDYILYCHPEIQKTPKSDKLREWYLTMLEKAKAEGIVVDVGNLYDCFFVQTNESRAKITAARLPYFDGDYWPGAAEEMILQLEEESQKDDGKRRPQKKPKKAKSVAKKGSGKGVAQGEFSTTESKDRALIDKLGESIGPMKEDFIMVHMHYVCSHCRDFILSGSRWLCKQCKNPFQLCNRCYEAERRRDDRERHPQGNRDVVHEFKALPVEPVQEETKDKDEMMESEFFDTRQAFLSLCQGNHYQYDTLRRAKHSSMMVLYHLHNPGAPAYVCTCNICQKDIETGQGWRCTTCQDYDLCNVCKKEANHPHKLVPHPSMAEQQVQNQEGRQQRIKQMRKMLELLVHASGCGTQQCQYPSCLSVKALFRHGINCKQRISGGCPACRKMWTLLQFHARICKQSECSVPRCRDLKEHRRRLQQQMESRRRAAVKEMMRQRAAEAAAQT
ncbi:hypothetical protein CBR_g37148 [Chara braunii]|uniref:histone acetyltransferase n=1 Tax=Chara braunii TaxID=69332 RepID=A0A388LMI6_CHABU|nr:hypothetical protein CBR_g37148 [Chara braunii]|eukprot:GBG83435.1 hypothetical protein CBR_g37148 [Chara braunii]